MVRHRTDRCRTGDARRTALHRTARALRAAGARPTGLVDQVPVAELTEAHAMVMAHEAARSLAAEARHPEALSIPLRELLDRGARTPASEYRAALATARAARTRILGLLAHTDVILGPAAPGPAPYGVDATGTPVLSRCWQLHGLPVVTVPGHRDPDGMPLGLQLVGHPERVGRLLGIARRTEQLIAGTSLARHPSAIG
ncbi:amidase family protein [Streptomyces sp. NPDC088124]|uniref:amidase family protein n=1 Tax=Streptomyces sp. NPDC088124 TaxID=3154654 RepID=UPI003435EDF3